jgi:hypothetical protein
MKFVDIPEELCAVSFEGGMEVPGFFARAFFRGLVKARNGNKGLIFL